MSDERENAVQTDIAQGLHYTDPETGSVVPPIIASTTFARDEDYQLIAPEHSYTRDENPTYKAAEDMLARLENGSDALFVLFRHGRCRRRHPGTKTGDRVVAPAVMYWGLRNWMVEFCANWGIELVQFDTADPDDFARVVGDAPTTLVWIETPCNPTWDVIDIAAAAKVAHDAGARLAVDSTVATPVLTQPLKLGADIVMHSATKYLNGHGDVLAGGLVTKAADDLWARIQHNRAEFGAIPGPFEAWLLQRGMRTLFLRVRNASQSALAIARHFEGHAALESVRYPGLESHPGHEIAASQMQGGFGGMLSFCVGDGESAALDFVRKVNVFIRATSLGGVESLIEHRYSIEGPSSPIPEESRPFECWRRVAR